MLKKKCSLCGGNLIGGRCQDCGLDNNKKRMSRAGDEMEGYKPWAHSSDAFGDASQGPFGGASHTSGKEMSNDEFFKQLRAEQREMEVEDVYNRSEQIEYSRPPQRNPIEDIIGRVLKPASYSPKAQPNSNRNSTGGGTRSNTANRGKTNAKKSPLMTIIRIIIILTIFTNVFGVVISLIFSAISSLTSGVSDLFVGIEEMMIEEEIVYENDIDFSGLQGAGIELEETGEVYLETLVAGYYEVGVHIPEGQYTITCEAPGSLKIKDDENGISIYEYFWDENIGDTFEEVNLYNGTIVKLDNEVRLIFESTNANYEKVEYIENPNTEDYYLTTGAYVAGVDFPAGVYDFIMPEGSFSIIEIYESEEEYNNEDSWEYESIFMCNLVYEEAEEYQMTECHNMIIPEGFVISVENEANYIEYLEITPSEVMKDEEYIAPYDFLAY